jgi:hypothetical protein
MDKNRALPTDPTSLSGYGDDLNDKYMFERMRGSVEERKSPDKEKGFTFFNKKQTSFSFAPLVMIIPLLLLVWVGSVMFADRRGGLSSPLPMSGENVFLDGEGLFQPGVGGGPEDLDESTPSASPSDKVILFEKDSQTREL